VQLAMVRLLLVVAVATVGAGWTAPGGGALAQDDATTCAGEPFLGAAGTDASPAAGGEGGASPAAGGGGEELDIAFLPKDVVNNYFVTAAGGAEEAAAELGGQFQQVGPESPNAAEQVTFIETLTQQEVSAIVVSANDPDALAPALREAMEQGIDVVSYDSDVAADARMAFVNQARSEDIGRIQVQIMGRQFDCEGEIAILSAASTATNQNAWIEVMETYAAEEYPDIEIVATVYGDDEDEKSFQETQGLLQTYPDLKGIISPTTVGISAAARYLSGSEYKGRVALTGLGTPNQMREFVKDGTVTAFALWNPADLGYLAAYAGAALAAGQITGAEGETFEAGELGEYTVGADGEIVLGDPTVFNADNIDDFDF
jgi:rhamnose transport system substrate-binding protein